MINLIKAPQTVVNLNYRDLNILMSRKSLINDPSFVVYNRRVLIILTFDVQIRKRQKPFLLHKITRTCSFRWWNRFWNGHTDDLQDQGGVSGQDYEHLQRRSISKGTSNHENRKPINAIRIARRLVVDFKWQTSVYFLSIIDRVNKSMIKIHKDRIAAQRLCE